MLTRWLNLHKISRYCELLDLPSDELAAERLLVHSYLTGATGLLAGTNSYQLAQLLKKPAVESDIYRWCVENKIFVPSDSDELSILLRDNVKAAESSTELYRVIIPTNRCNFGCTYCGQKHGNLQM